MKYAVISDVHGNAHALRLALEDARQQGAQGFLFAGDYCISLPWGRETVALIRQTENAYVIRGNDEAHLDVPPGEDAQFAASRWCMSTLSAEDKAWLDALPERLDLVLEGVPVHMAHSSQAFIGKSLHERFRTSVLPGFYPDGPIPRETLLADFRRLWEKAEFRSHIHSLATGVYIFGHNHIQAWGDFDGRVLVNPGSVGMPLDCGEFGAAYTLMTIEDGRVRMEERRVPYDRDCLIGKFRQSGQYAAAPIWSEIIIAQLETVREKVWQFLHFCDRYAQSVGDARRPFAPDTWEAAYAQWAAHAREWHPELFV